MYYGARYYDPDLSRFITPDTLYDKGPQGLNRYSYALNNPLRYHDPSGHLSIVDHFSPDDEDTWTPLPTISQEAGEFEDLGDGMIASTTDLAVARFGELSPPPRLSYWRRNFVSRYVGDVLMFAESVLSGNTSSWSDCNRMTRDCYSPKESFDRRFGVFTDVTSGIAMGSLKKTSSIVKGTGITPGKDIAFGRQQTLRSFTRKTRGRSYYAWVREGLSLADPMVRKQFVQAFREAISNARQIHFNLDGLNLKRAYLSGMKGPFDLPGNVTNWEFRQVLGNSKTIFWQNGRIVPRERVLQRLGGLAQ